MAYFRYSASNAGALGTGNVANNTALASTDNAIVRWDGTSGFTVQNSAVTINNSGDLAATDASGPQLENAASSTTNATLIPNRSAPASGVGGAADAPALIVGGVSKLTVNSTQTTVANKLQFDSASIVDGTTDGFVRFTTASGSTFTGLRFGPNATDAQLMNIGSRILRIKGSDSTGSSNSSDGGLYCLSVRLTAGDTSGNGVIDLSRTAIKMYNACTIGWSNSNTTGTDDIGLARNAAGVLKVTDGSTGIGALLWSRVTTANTAVAASPKVLTAADSGSTWHNTGTTAQNVYTLPTPAAGLQFRFICQDSDGLKVNCAAGGQTIRDGSSVSSSGGSAALANIGDVMELQAISTTEWYVVGGRGTAPTLA